MILDATIDNAMFNLIQRKVIKVGTKLLIHGSEIIGTPSPCHPLEVIFLELVDIFFRKSKKYLKKIFYFYYFNLIVQEKNSCM